MKVILNKKALLNPFLIFINLIFIVNTLSGVIGLPQ